MKQVIEKIGELHGLLVEKINKANRLIEETNAFNSEIIERASNLSARESALTAREFAVEQVENVVALKAEAERLMAEVIKDRAALDNEQESWRKACAIEKQEMVKEHTLIDQEAKNNEANKKNIEEEVTKRVTELMGKMRK